MFKPKKKLMPGDVVVLRKHPNISNIYWGARAKVTQTTGDAAHITILSSHMCAGASGIVEREYLVAVEQ